MKLDEEFSRPATWLMRTIGWGVAAVFLVAGYWITASMKLGHHVIACFERTKAPRPGESALDSARTLAACIEGESGWFERPLVWLQAKPLEAAGPPPCKYVGLWKARRGDTVYAVHLNLDGRFDARPVPPAGGERYTGTWIVANGKISWLYDGMPVWPPDTNPVVDESPQGFTLVERNGATTRYERQGPVTCTAAK